MVRRVLRSTFSRGLTRLLIAGQVLAAIQASAQAPPAAQTPGSRLLPPGPVSTPPPPAPKVTVNKTVPRVTPPPLEPVFSSPPTTAEITRARIFPEPLVPLGGEPTAGENGVLARVLLAFHRSGGTRWEPIVSEFLLTHPESVWRSSLLAGVASAQLRAHAYSLALESWNDAWTLAKNGTDAKGRAVKAQTVDYVLDDTIKPPSVRPLKQRAGKEFVYYEYQGDDDRRHTETKH